MFLLPVLWIQASLGLAYVLKVVCMGYPARFAAITAIGGVLLAGWLGYRTWRGLANRPPIDGFRSAESTAGFLATILEPGDRVVASVPSISPLEYYFVVSGLPIGYLHAAWESSDRLVVVVNNETQSLTGVLQWNTEWQDLPLDHYSEPEEVASIGDAVIYVMEPQQ